MEKVIFDKLWRGKKTKKKKHPLFILLEENEKDTGIPIEEIQVTKV